MNSNEQKTHKTAVNELRLLLSQMEEDILTLTANLSAAIERERQHSMELADEMREAISQETDHRINMTREHDRLCQDLNARLESIEMLTFWGRLRWLFTGKLP